MKAMRLVRRAKWLLLVAPLLAVALVAPMVATAPASAQSVTTTVFVLQHVPDGTNEKWEVRVEIEPLGGCTPSNFRYSPTWIAEGSLYAARVSDDCRYSITMEAREVGDSDRGICLAEWAWGTSGVDPATLTYATTKLLLGDFSLIQERLYVRHEGENNPSCAAVQTSRFRINGEDVVTPLPTNSLDSALSARAVRAAAVAEFSVLVEPDYDTASDIPEGCHKAETIKVKGDGAEKRLTMAAATPAGTGCTYRAKVTSAPPPFKIVNTSPVSFVAGGLVNLSSKVKLPLARIAIIQQVSGSNNEGAVRYQITRSCATGLDLPPPVGGTSGGVIRLPGGITMVELREGRFTVHYPATPNFGAAYTYQAVATSDSSNIIAGCSVSTTISEVPANCSVSGPLTKTVTWSSSRPVESYDFEFRLTCRAAASTTTTAASSPTSPVTTTTQLVDACDPQAEGESCMSNVDDTDVDVSDSATTSATAAPGSATTSAVTRTTVRPGPEIDNPTG